MPLVIHTEDQQRAAGGNVGPLVADRRLYTDATKSVVLEEGDETAAYVLCGKGSTIPAATVRKLGLVVERGRVIQPKEKPAAPVEHKEVKPAEDKQAAPPKENKAKGRR